MTCASCTREQVERTPRTEAGRKALRAAIERRVAVEAEARERSQRGVAAARAALAAAKRPPEDVQAVLW